MDLIDDQAEMLDGSQLTMSFTYLQRRTDITRLWIVLLGSLDGIEDLRDMYIVINQ